MKRVIMMTSGHFLAVGATLSAAALWIACSADAPAPLPERPECETEYDCINPPDPECGTQRCIEGKCQREVWEYSGQYPGDCMTMACDSDGFKVAVPAPDDVPEDGNPCTDDLCDGTRALRLATRRGPAPDDSGLCDGARHLVECLSDADCVEPSTYCSPNSKCVPLACNNGELDTDIGESYVDCGGLCDPCIPTFPCNTGADCFTGVCGFDKRCSRATCSDGVQNANEADIDCGSNCRACAAGDKCREASECLTKVCFMGRCQAPSCDDDRQNGREVGRDCGGDCPPCPEGSLP
ncbi:hypothetical protein BE20_17645 [Sorangium cellulosum]|uniref:Secreted protein n=1 Tax=Sorangium cellulosum TaxID=56 RepID=A0A150SD80_SORCE|nr:hypothetical protein BE20_17645 [Sorangium cellulosum]KYF98883.1 hypothetical protein BE18_16365 [Sorangium cellulosum]